MKQLHEIQLQILKKLLFATDLRYSKLKPSADIENNQFSFHLDQLIAGNYITKVEKGYRLTSFGKEYANRMDTVNNTVSMQSKISAWICCTRKYKGNNQFLIYTRLKQPFYGCQGFPSGKVNYGEKVVDAAKRELMEETSLVGDPKVILIRHYLVFDKQSNGLVEDKFMFLCLVKNPKGKVLANNEGLYEWISEKDFKTKVTNYFESWDAFEELMGKIRNYKGKLELQEIKYWSDKF